MSLQNSHLVMIDLSGAEHLRPTIDKIYQSCNRIHSNSFFMTDLSYFMTESERAGKNMTELRNVFITV